MAYLTLSRASVAQAIAQGRERAAVHQQLQRNATRERIAKEKRARVLLVQGLLDQIPDLLTAEITVGKSSFLLYTGGYHKEVAAAFRRRCKKEGLNHLRARVVEGIYDQRHVEISWD